MDGMDRPPALSAAGVIAEMQEEQSIPGSERKKTTADSGLAGDVFVTYSTASRLCTLKRSRRGA